MAELSVVATLKGIDDASPAFAKATAALANFGKAAGDVSGSTQTHTSAMSKAFGALGTAVTAPISAIGKLASVVGAGLGVAAGFQVFNSLGAAIGSAGGAAIGFEKSMSAVGAVSGATGTEMKALSGLALELGKQTSFSASQAAQGIGELVKGGVSIADVMGGAASAALNLAAAGGLSVGEAATIASNAMNQFNLTGGDMTHVSDLIAGAANASSIEVHDFNLSLASVGATAHLAGQSFDSTAVAIAQMGAQGIKGSDAGTSLKSMLIGLLPSTKEATAAMQKLGLITADGRNQFVDAHGAIKDYGAVSEILKRSLTGLSEAEQVMALKTIFGTDGMRAAAVAANQGIEGYDKMAAAMGKVTAASVAMEKLNNVAGDIEQLKGSFETAAIVLVGTFAPAFRPAIQAATELTNRFTQEAQTIIQTAQNMAGAHGIGMLPAVLSAVELRIGEVFGSRAQGAFHAMRAAVETVGQALSGDLSGALVRMGVPLDAVQRGMALAQGAMDGAAEAGGRITAVVNGIAGALSEALAWITKTEGGLVLVGAAAGLAAGALGVWAVSAGLAGAAALGTTLGMAALTASQWLLNAALTANPIGIVVVALAALAGALTVAYNTNETFRANVDAAWAAVGEAAGAMSVAVSNALSAITPYWNSLVASNDRNAATFRATWAGLVADHDRSAASIREAISSLEPAWATLTASNDRNAATFRQAWDDLAHSTERNAETIRAAIEGIGPAWDAVTTGATDMASAVLQSLGDLVRGAVRSADDTNAAMLGTNEGWDATVAGAQGMVSAVGAVLATLGEAAGQASAAVGERFVALGPVWEQVAAGAAGMASSAGASLAALGEGAGAFAAAVLSHLQSLGAPVWDAVASAAGAMVAAVGGFLSALGEAAGRAAAAVKAALAEVVGAVAGLPAQVAGPAQAAGASIASGLAGGIRAGLPGVIGAAVAVAQAAIGAARAALDSHSPSKVFEDIGESIPEGLVVGVEGGQDDLIGAVEAMLADATASAETGVAEYVATFDGLGELIGAAFEQALGPVEKAQRDLNDKLEDEARAFGRRRADLEEELGGAQAKERQSVLDKIAQIEEDHARKVEDLQRDGGDRLVTATRQQALERGKAIREMQRATEELERDTADKSAEMHAKAEDARRDAFRSTADAIRKATDDTNAAIRDLNDRRDEAFSLRSRRDVFSTGQDTAARAFSTGREDVDLALRQTEQLAERKASLEESAAQEGRQRSREDADARYQLARDLADAVTAEDKAKVQERFDRSQADLARRRAGDDEERAYKAKEDADALDASFKKAKTDLEKRRLAEQQERDFRKRQETERRDFEDGLAQEALNKQVQKLETERDERIRTLNEALQDKLRQIDDSENKEREALRKSHDQKLADIKERFLDKVGPLTGEALTAFESLFDGIKSRIEESTAAVASLATAMGKAAQQTLPSGGGATWANQSQSVRDMFTGTYGAGAQAKWESEHAAEIKAQPQQSSGGGGGGGSAPAQTSDVHAPSFDWGAYNAQNQGAPRNPDGTVKRARGGSLYAGQVATVGEHGSETFIPWTDGMIAPHGASMGAGGGGTVIVHLHLDNATILGGEKQKVAAELVGAIRTELLKFQQRNGGTGIRA